MMPDDHDTEKATSEFERDELVGLIGNCYVRNGLSPPTQLRGAVKRWMGLSHGEILAAIEQHFEEHRRLYTCGSGDGHFHLVETAVRRAWQAKHPARVRAEDEPVRPQRRASRVRKLHNAAGGPPDMFVEGRAARLVRQSESNVERPSGLVGYERAGVPIIEDDSGEDA
jgi:hypothetical protein